mmetsp:Transcript_53019/g.169786  ORF Transcript_53019/g.169786 Transcript_53019/m.169786 type:complete len:307 (-) Transcript_53019:27-947(-)
MVVLAVPACQMLTGLPSALIRAQGFATSIWHTSSWCTKRTCEAIRSCAARWSLMPGMSCLFRQAATSPAFAAAHSMLRLQPIKSRRACCSDTFAQVARVCDTSQPMSAARACCGRTSARTLKPATRCSHLSAGAAWASAISSALSGSWLATAGSPLWEQTSSLFDAGETRTPKLPSCTIAPARVQVTATDMATTAKAMAGVTLGATPPAMPSWTMTGATESANPMASLRATAVRAGGASGVGFSVRQSGRAGLATTAAGQLAAGLMVERVEPLQQGPQGSARRSARETTATARPGLRRPMPGVDGQ